MNNYPYRAPAPHPNSYTQYQQHPANITYYQGMNYPPAPGQLHQAEAAPKEFGKGDRWGNPFDDNEDGMLLHTILDGDSLMGLSLTYGVPVQSIKKANGITSDEIYYLHTIKIPKPQRYKPQEGSDDPGKQLLDKQVNLKQAFKNRTGESNSELIEKYLSRTAFNYQDAVELYEREKGMLEKRKQQLRDLKQKMDKDDRDDKIATYYLELCNWNYDEALKAYKEDLHHGSISPHPQYQQHTMPYGQGIITPTPYRVPVLTAQLQPTAVGPERFVYCLKKEQ
jgi:LysM repeat protein